MGGGFRGRTNTHQVGAEVEKERERRIFVGKLACRSGAWRARPVDVRRSFSDRSMAMAMAMPCTQRADGQSRPTSVGVISSPVETTPDMNLTLPERERAARRWPRCAAHGWLRSKSNEPKSDELAGASPWKPKRDPRSPSSRRRHTAQKSVNCERKSCTWRVPLTRHRRRFLKGESKLH